MWVVLNRLRYLILNSLGIRHDWNDQRCVDILKNMRKVMRPDSKVLISWYILYPLFYMLNIVLVDEYLLRPATPISTSVNSLDNAPIPLLSNTGAGRSRLYGLDIIIMGLCNSKERFLDEYIGIAEQAGLRLKGVWGAGDANTLEFVIA